MLVIKGDKDVTLPAFDLLSLLLIGQKPRGANA